MSEPVFEATIPIVRIFDLAKAKEFYLDFLGFSLRWEHRFEPELPVYLEIARGELVLHLSEHYGDACPGSTVFVRMRGIQAFHQELITKKYNYLRPGLCKEPWNALGMEVVDPFGNRLRFSEDLKTAGDVGAGCAGTNSG
jgi:hypothetical protein